MPAVVPCAGNIEIGNGGGNVTSSREPGESPAGRQAEPGRRGIVDRLDDLIGINAGNVAVCGPEVVILSIHTGDDTERRRILDIHLNGRCTDLTRSASDRRPGIRPVGGLVDVAIRSGERVLAAPLVAGAVGRY